MILNSSTLATDDTSSWPAIQDSQVLFLRVDSFEALCHLEKGVVEMREAFCEWREEDTM